MKSVAVLIVFCAAIFGVVASECAEAAGFPTKLYLSADGLALSSFPSRQNLTQTIGVDRTQGKTSVGWTARSDQPWLTPTASGETGGNLTVVANPSNLPENVLNRAHVTVSTTGGDFTDSETLTVGLWVGSTDPASPISLSQNALRIVTNPVSPIAYTSDGGSDILLFNVYSGQLVATIKTAAPTIAALEISSDGNTLFAADSLNNRIIAFNAAGKQVARYPLHYAIGRSFTMAYARPFGQPAIFAQGGPIIAIPAGTRLATGLPNYPITASRDGKLLFSLRNNEFPNTLSNYSISVAGDRLAVTPQAYLLADVSDLAVTRDSRRIYISGGLGAPYDFFGFSAEYLFILQSLAADAYPDNVEIDENNRIIGGISPGQGGTNDIYVYNQAGYLLGTVAATPEIQNYDQQPGQMKVSGDATRVVVVTAPYAGQTLVFRSLP